jgi:hypothetical protein
MPAMVASSSPCARSSPYDRQTPYRPSSREGRNFKHQDAQAEDILIIILLSSVHHYKIFWFNLISY